MLNWDLKGKKAVITGATKGIGKAINEEFLRLGASTLIISRNEEEVKSLAEQYRSEGYDCMGMAADLSTEIGREATIEKVEASWTHLDVLVNNVGMNIRKETLEYELADLRKIMETNVESAFVLSLKLFPLLERSTGASVINLSSITSMNVVQTSTAAYHMSKGALDQMTNYLAVEWGKENIRVNSIHPWYISTPLGNQILEDEDKREKIISVTPLGRVGTPEEVAAVAAFLAMNVSSYISGANINVDGAFSKAGMPLNY